MRRTTRVFIIDDHPVVRAGLRELLRHSREISIVGEAEDAGAETLTRLHDASPDVAIIDIKLKRGNGVDFCRELKGRERKVGVILLSAFWDDQLLRQALDAGADGYLLKDAEQLDLAKSVLSVARGEPVFDGQISAAIVRQARGQAAAPEHKVSDDDAHVLRLVASGLTNKTIAQALCLSPHTVRDRLSALMASLGAKNRAEAAQIATRRGVI